MLSTSFWYFLFSLNTMFTRRFRAEKSQSLANVLFWETFPHLAIGSIKAFVAITLEPVYFVSALSAMVANHAFPLAFINSNFTEYSLKTSLRAITAEAENKNPTFNQNHIKNGCYEHSKKFEEDLHCSLFF